MQDSPIPIGSVLRAVDVWRKDLDPLLMLMVLSVRKIGHILLPTQRKMRLRFRLTTHCRLLKCSWTRAVQTVKTVIYIQGNCTLNGFLFLMQKYIRFLLQAGSPGPGGGVQSTLRHAYSIFVFFGR